MCVWGGERASERERERKREAKKTNNKGEKDHRNREIQGVSLLRRLLPATHAHKEILEQNNVNEANRRLANAKSSMLQENNPDAACMHHTNRYRTGRRVLYRKY